MNKSLLTNLLALALLAGGYQTDNQIAYYAGLFAFSGAITNWLAIHMLFEKVMDFTAQGSFQPDLKSLRLPSKP